MEFLKFKEMLEKGLYKGKLIVIQHSNADIVIDTYIDRIKDLTKLKVKYLNDINVLYEPVNGFLKMLDTEKYLTVYKIDNELKLKQFNYDSLENVIIVTKKLDKASKELIKQYLVEIPELENWMINAYFKKCLPKINPIIVDWLCDITNYNFDRLSTEVDKLALFSDDKQEEVFKILNNDNAYIDLCDKNIYDLSNAIIKRDYLTIANILESIEFIDVEPLGLVTILLNNFSKMIQVKCSSYATAESLGMSTGQFYVIAKNCNLYSQTQIIEIYKFLLSIDSQLKSGDIYDKIFLDYIIMKTLSF